MTSPSFLTDEDFRQEIVEAVLRFDPAVDIVGVRDVGLSGANDPQVLEFASEHSRILVSHDANTMIANAIDRIADGRGIGGLLIVPQSANLRAVAEDLVLVANASEPEEWRDRIDYLPM